MDYFEKKISELQQELGVRKNLLIKKTTDFYNEYYAEEQRIMKEIEDCQAEIQKSKKVVKEEVKEIAKEIAKEETKAEKPDIKRVK